MRTTAMLRKMVTSYHFTNTLAFGIGALGAVYLENQRKELAEITKQIDVLQRQRAHKVFQYTHVAQVINELNAINSVEDFEQFWGLLSKSQIERFTSTPKRCMALMLSVGANCERIFRNNYALVFKREGVVDDDRTESQNRPLRTRLNQLRDNLFVDIYAGAAANIVSARDHLSDYMQMFDDYDYAPQSSLYLSFYRQRYLDKIYPASGFVEYFLAHKDIASLFDNNRQLFDYFADTSRHRIRLHHVINSKEKAIEYLLRAETYRDVEQIINRIDGTSFVRDAIQTMLDPANDKLFTIISGGITYEGALQFMLSFMREGPQNIDLSLNQKAFLKRLGTDHPVLAKLSQESSATLFKKGYTLDVVTHLLTEIPNPPAVAKCKM